MKKIGERGQAIIEYLFLLIIMLFVVAFILKFVVKNYLFELPKSAIEAIEAFFAVLVEHGF
ncbi:MAG: hypothetical protein ACUVUG_05085 [Candidatus Aminicenantia bacterium]